MVTRGMRGKMERNDADRGWSRMDMERDTYIWLNEDSCIVQNSFDSINQTSQCSK